MLEFLGMIISIMFFAAVIVILLFITAFIIGNILEIFLDLFW